MTIPLRKLGETEARVTLMGLGGEGIPGTVYPFLDLNVRLLL